jgi:alpha-beta hydrolase superfamily lysophospholipase
MLVDVRAGGRDQPRPAVVIVHGFKGFKNWGMFPPLADRLARAGFTAVSLDLSGSGYNAAGDFVFPERFGHDTFSTSVDDVTRSIDALAAGNLDVAAPTSIGMLGHSRGGGVAILEASSDPRISALVTWSSISTVNRWPGAVVREWRAKGRTDILNVRTGQVSPLYTDVLDDNERNAGRLDILAAAERLAIPWLVVHGEEDLAVRVGEARTLATRTRHPASRAEIIPGASHTFGAVHPWAGMTPDLERAFAATIAWFARHLVP